MKRTLKKIRLFFLTVLVVFVALGVWKGPRFIGLHKLPVVGGLFSQGDAPTKQSGEGSAAPKTKGACQKLELNSDVRMDCCIKEAYKCFGLSEEDESEPLVDAYVDACAYDYPGYAELKKSCVK